ncbi:hypothetical protein CCR75_002350 [Bremia lactucae]|uniref:BZIP domain-containing protein n=1 Tax=Bremia lactucae TaxID=4779 RepID=A0A976FNP3_BRELC|nr:hypothetical protein CCR75_002350 [Bremia lactucae]
MNEETKPVPSDIDVMWLLEKDPFFENGPSERRSALELRREKNRESMRRSRQRQRDRVQVLFHAVQQLEEQYKCLRRELDVKPQVCYSTTCRKYTDVVQLINQLGAEKLYLKASLQAKVSWQHQLSRVLETKTALDLSATSWTKEWSFLHRFHVATTHEVKAVFRFRDVTLNDVNDLIMKHTRLIQRVQHELLASDEWRSQTDPSNRSNDVRTDIHDGLDEVFGWALRRRLCGSVMEFVFTKRFPTLAVAKVMQKAWENEMNWQGAQVVKYDVQRLVMLQKINSHAYVLGRDVQSPDKAPVFRTSLLRYRMATSGHFDSLRGVANDKHSSHFYATGVVIGTQSVAPIETTGHKMVWDTRESSACVVWPELAHSIEMLQIVDARTGENQYVHVRWGGQTNYGSAFDARRNAADMVTTLLRWELATIAPAIELMPTGKAPVVDASLSVDDCFMATKD